MSIEIRDVITQVVGQLSTSRAAKHYLDQYCDTDAPQFAIVKVGGAILRDEQAEAAAALALLRHLGLIPIVIHGAGPQLDTALREAGVDVQ